MILPKFQIGRACRAMFDRLRSDERGNVMLLVGLSLVPMMIATGMGIDYSRAMKTQTKLNAAADAAALAGVTLPMMNQSNKAACTAAKNMFIAQASGLSGLTLDFTNPTQLTITVTDSQTKGGPGTTTDCNSASSATTAASYSRTINVTYTGQSANTFAGILGVNSLTVHGSSQTQAAVAPNIDFYLMLDVSPSMAIAATQAGIDMMVANTSMQGGCAFACHQVSVGNGDTQGNPTDPSTGKQMDNFALARSLNVVLRTDLVTAAAKNLMDVAQSTAQSNNAKYQIAISSFDTSARLLQAKTADFSAAKTAAGNAVLQTVYSNGNALAADGKSAVANNDTDTNFTAMAALVDSTITTPGNGTNAAGDKPQGMIFIVTDGVRDEQAGNRVMGQLTDLTPKFCDAEKAKGFRIAILYTNYLPLPTNPFYNQNIAPFRDQIAPNLQSCASPGLYSTVTTGDDISAALTRLFQAAVSTAHLTR